LRDEIAASLACHAAIKVNMPLAPEKMLLAYRSPSQTSSPTTVHMAARDPATQDARYLKGSTGFDRYNRRERFDHHSVSEKSGNQASGLQSQDLVFTVETTCTNGQ